MPSARKIAKAAARKTQLQLQLQLTAPKPRNPLVALAAQRKAGLHRKTRKAQRRAERVALRQGRAAD